METTEFSLLLTLISIYTIGYIGYFLVKKLNIPAPGLIGSLVANAIITSFGVNWAAIPIEISIILQVLIGIMVGSQFTKEKLIDIKKLAFPSLFVGTWMIGIGLLLGYFISKFAFVDIGTALFSAVPGGMTEMSVLAMVYNLHVPTVVLFQFLRIVMVYFLVPIFAKHINDNHILEKDEICKCSKYINVNDYNILVTLLIGLISGYIAWKINIPGGAIIGSLIVVGGLRSYGVKLKAMPTRYSVLTQIGLGAILGLTFTPEVATNLTRLFTITILFSIITVLNGIILGYLVHRIFKLDLSTSLLACAAAGVSQMSAIALDMNADAVIVSVIQSIRLITTVIILPPIIVLIMD